MANTLEDPRSSWETATYASRASFRPITSSTVESSAQRERITRNASASHSKVAEPRISVSRLSRNQAWVIVVPSPYQDLEAAHGVIHPNLLAAD